MSDEMKYEVHTESGETWYCRDILYVQDLDIEHPSWVDPDIDLVMVGAVEKRLIYVTDVQPTIVYLTQTPVAVAALQKEIRSAFEGDTVRMMEDFA